MVYYYHMIRRVGRYTKYETAELTRMFGEGYSVYNICRNLNPSQNSIRNNLIRLDLMEGEITPKRYTTKRNYVVLLHRCAQISVNQFKWDSNSMTHMVMY